MKKVVDAEDWSAVLGALCQCIEQMTQVANAYRDDPVFPVALKDAKEVYDRMHPTSERVIVRIVKEDGKPILFFPDIEANLGIQIYQGEYTSASIGYYLNMTRPPKTDAEKFAAANYLEAYIIRSACLPGCRYHGFRRVYHR
jgi:hypothetical protein